MTFKLMILMEDNLNLKKKFQPSKATFRLIQFTRKLLYQLFFLPSFKFQKRDEKFEIA
jgi:hypothetical protein